MGKSANATTKATPKRVIVFAAHGDDEVLGCGGTIRRHATQGDEVSIVIFADGETSRGTGQSSAAIAQREAAARKAAGILGAAGVVACQFPDNQLDTVPLLDLAKLAEKHIADLRPDTVY